MRMKMACMVWTLAFAVLVSTCPPTGAAPLDETSRAAVYLLRSSMKVQRSNRHLRMLRAIRELGDPQLAPFFSRLIDERDDSLRIHGILGLAECSDKKQLDLVRLTEYEKPILIRKTVGWAMDLDLVTLDQARQLMDWPGLDASVKLVVTTHLVRHEQPVDKSFLREAMQSEKLGRSTTAAMLLVQLGQDDAMETLNKLNASDHPMRDRLRGELLRTAFAGKFDRMGPWALTVYGDETANPSLRQRALVVALRFGAPGAAPTWRQQYQSASVHLQKIKSAMVALNASYWVAPSLFDPLIDSDDEMLHQIGKTGAAVALRQGVVDAVLDILDMNHLQVNNWALDYAKELATPGDAQTILLGLILAFDGPKERVAHRLQRAVAATTLLADRYSESAGKLLQPILLDSQTKTPLIRGMLTGLLQCRQSDPYPVIDGLTTLGDPQSDNLMLLITAKFEHPLTDAQLRDLALLVRGGGHFPRHMRVQAAWAYLKLTGQTRPVLAQVLGQ